MPHVRLNLVNQKCEAALGKSLLELLELRVGSLDVLFAWGGAHQFVKHVGELRRGLLRRGPWVWTLSPVASAAAQLPTPSGGSLRARDVPVALTLVTTIHGSLRSSRSLRRGLVNSVTSSTSRKVRQPVPDLALLFVFAHGVFLSRTDPSGKRPSSV